MYIIYLKIIFFRVHLNEIDLKIEKTNRPDMIFIRKHGPLLFTSLYESLELPNNTSENVETIYTTMALLTAELLSEETIMDFIRLLLSIQDMTLTSTSLSASQKAQLLAVVISVFSLIPNVMGIEPLRQYANEVIFIIQINCVNFFL